MTPPPGAPPPGAPPPGAPPPGAAPPGAPPPGAPPPGAPPTGVSLVRDAASLIVWKHEGGATAILMGMRGAGHRFMPNKLVFPGGAVDAADTGAACASPLATATRTALGRAASAELAQALAIAAARELEEETGLTLGDPPKLDGLHYLCRAVTPPSSPIRFNARFLIVAAEHVSGTIAGSGELEQLRFFTLGELHQLDLAWITREVLSQFEAWLHASEDERKQRTQFPVCESQRWTLE